MRLLLLEPDRRLAEIYGVALEQAGHDLISCTTAQAAILAADEQMPDVVVMEVQLIGHSGIEFLYEFRSYSEWQSIPVLIHSQVPAAEFAGSWSLLHDDLGVRDYLYKPTTSLATLLSTVQTHAAQTA